MELLRQIILMNMETKLLMNLRVYFTLLLSTLFVMCDPIDNKLVIVNDSNEKLYFVTSPYINLSRLYEDGLEQHGIKIKYTNYVESVEPHSEFEAIKFGNENAWERYINEFCEEGKLRIYSFEIDTLKKYSWKDVIENDLYSKKMEYSVKELQEKNWRINF